MTLLTTSAGIFKKQELIETCLQHKLAKIKAPNHLDSSDVIVGWGVKANTAKAKKIAVDNQLDYLHLEDGFIGYVGHPAKGGHGISVIADPIGVYYDAGKPSTLEALISQPKSAAQIKRSAALIDSIKSNCITKYNCYSDSKLPVQLAKMFAADNNHKVLIVDQVAGDLSIEGALASQQSFVNMVASAKKDYPDSTLYLRTHPDTRFGKKSGVLAKLNVAGVVVIDDACHPHAIINAVDNVYTVSSQMGFEALILNKPVKCFGMPFYAGWGLTQDALMSDRAKGISLESLVQSALVEYPKYYNPITKQSCQVEDAIELIANQYQDIKWECLYAVNFSLWKRAFIITFCKKSARKIKFVKVPPKSIGTSENILVWGMQFPELERCIRVEDGFIRSSGLGSNLCRPSSLAFDELGIYFNSHKVSQLEDDINHIHLNGKQLERVQKLLTTLKINQISKYNVGHVDAFVAPNNGKKVLLVVGQVDGDASIKLGSPVITSNEALLWAVRNSNPDTHIIYKPHPDVVAGNREGAISAECLEQCVDEHILELTLTSLYPHIDELHTMTSLSGFEALVQGVNVVTWGQPFYSGWGLSKDINPPERRTKKLTLEELIYVTLIQYPVYIDWSTGFVATPEQIIEQIKIQQNNQGISLNQLERAFIKIGYLWQTLTMRLSF